MVWVLCCNLEMLSSWWQSAWSSAASLLCCGLDVHSTGIVSSKHVFWLSIKGILLTLCSFFWFLQTQTLPLTPQLYQSYYFHYESLQMWINEINYRKHLMSKSSSWFISSEQTLTWTLSPMSHSHLLCLWNSSDQSSPVRRMDRPRHFSSCKIITVSKAH